MVDEFSHLGPLSPRLFLPKHGKIVIVIVIVIFLTVSVTVMIINSKLDFRQFLRF